MSEQVETTPIEAAAGKPRIVGWIQFVGVASIVVSVLAIIFALNGMSPFVPVVSIAAGITGIAWGIIILGFALLVERVVYLQEDFEIVAEKLGARE